MRRPTAAEINACSPEIREHIHRLETAGSNADLVLENAHLRENIACLEAAVLELQATDKGQEMSEPQRHLMIDLETLGSGERANVPVLQVGGAVFSVDDGVATIHEKWSVNFGLDLATQDVVSPPISKSTMDWWRKQPDAVRDAVFFPERHLAGDRSHFYDLDDCGWPPPVGALLDLLSLLCTKPEANEDGGQPFDTIWALSLIHI